MRKDPRNMKSDEICFVKNEYVQPFLAQEIPLFESIKSDKSALKKLKERTKLCLDRWSEGFTEEDWNKNYPAHKEIDKLTEQYLIRMIAKRLWLREVSEGVFKK